MTLAEISRTVEEINASINERKVGGAHPLTCLRVPGVAGAIGASQFRCCANGSGTV